VEGVIGLSLITGYRHLSLRDVADRCVLSPIALLPDRLFGVLVTCRHERASTVLKDIVFVTAGLVIAATMHTERQITELGSTTASDFRIRRRGPGREPAAASAR
jgi:hypothetical protein